jgi:tRNA A58 N-methylase Trm61
MRTSRLDACSPFALLLTCLLAGGHAGCAVAATDHGEDGEAQQLIGVLALQPGERVADVGAGDGEWAVPLAAAVGPRGHVFATEVTNDLVAEIEDRIAADALDNVTALKGDDQDTGLPPACCDAILLRMVYHHFTDPSAMRASLKAALRPGGRIAIVDITPQKNWRTLEGVPDRGGHGISEAALIAEMTGEGFTVESRHSRWNDDPDRFCVVFKKNALR